MTTANIKPGDVFCEWYKGKPFRYLLIVEITGPRYLKYQRCTEDGVVLDKTKRSISTVTLARFRRVRSSL